jgi:hypothetical protein
MTFVFHLRWLIPSDMVTAPTCTTPCLYQEKSREMTSSCAEAKRCRGVYQNAQLQVRSAAQSISRSAYTYSCWHHQANTTDT